MTVGELVFANVIDQRVWDAEGERGAAGIYLAGVPGRAYPFTMHRAWKIGTGMVAEEVRFYGPSGTMSYRWGPVARRMLGSMDLTVETDVIEDGRFDETGVHLASFIVDGEVVSEVEVPVFLQQAPAKLAKDVEDGLKRSDVIWIGAGADGERRSAPAWFSYRNGRIYVLSAKEAGSEQSIPGILGSHEVQIVTRRKGRDTALGGFAAAVRILEGPEWDEAAKALADRRRSRVGSPGDSIARWRGSCVIAELTPIV